MSYRQSKSLFSPTSGLPVSRDHGFTLIELAITMAILLIVAGIGFIGLQPALRDVPTSNGYNATLQSLRQAREWAVNNRRTYLVTITAPNIITTTPLTNGVPAPIPAATMTLPANVQFVVAGTLPNPGPDLMGNGTAAVQFDIGVAGGLPNQIYFYPDGSAKDIAGNLNNGVLYVARPGDVLSTRAITLLGTAGKLRGWRVSNPTGTTWNRQ